jgi:FMN phosphatase YigB (HAD superfamily)
MQYSTLLLDIDNTLYHYDTCHKPALVTVERFFSDKLGIVGSQFATVYSLARKQVHQELGGCAASHHRLLYFQKMCEHLDLNPFKYALEADGLYWKTYFQHMKLYKGVIKLLQTCQHMKIVLVTDLVAETQYKKIHWLKLDGYISTLVTSEEAGVEKPHPHIFLKALHKVRCLPENACMVGDSFEKDILGAKAVGIEAYWFNPTHKIPAEKQETCKVFTNFEELLEMIQ